MEPLRKYDHLDREVETTFSPGEKVYRSFWGDSKKIKVRYHIFNKDVIVDVYDLRGNTIMTNESGNFLIFLKNFSIQNKKIDFRVQSLIVEEWKEKLKIK